jgi:glycosyltransferase involved in cell wall biosynthesis
MANVVDVTNEQENSLELTILMPCLNEAETIATCIKKASNFLKEDNISGEVLIADNGSTDGSQQIAARLGARVVDVPVRGYGSALKSGIDQARGKYFIMGDADDSYDFTRLHPFLDELRAGTQVVIGNRFKGGIAKGAMPFLHKYLGNPVLSFLGRLFFKLPIRDFHCGLRGGSTQAVRELNLKTPGMEFASEMIVKASLAGLSMSEVPATLAPDGRSRPPHLRTWRDGWRHLCFLLSYTPRWLFIYPGLALCLLGFIISLALLAGPIQLGSLTFSTKTLVFGCLCSLIGVQSLSFGMIVRQYGSNMGSLPPPRGWVMRMTSRDSFILVSTILLLFGVGLAVYSFVLWGRYDFGNMPHGWPDNLAIFAYTLIAMSLQLFFTSFICSIISAYSNNS